MVDPATDHKHPVDRYERMHSNGNTEMLWKLTVKQLQCLPKAKSTVSPICDSECDTAKDATSSNPDAKAKSQ